MGREQSSTGNVIFLSVAFGKFRQKKTDNGTPVTSETPESNVRVTKSGSESWAIEYDAISGYLENVFYKESREYGNSYEVVIKDGIEKFQISIKEKGNFMQPFLSVLPNILQGKQLRIKVWDYENKGKRKVGLAVEQDENPNTTEFNNANIVNNYYGRWEDKKFIPMNGFPKSDGVDWNDEDSRTYYNMQVRKFFRTEFDKLSFSDAEPEYTAGLEKETEALYPEVIGTGFPDPSTAPDDEDDLPF